MTRGRVVLALVGLLVLVLYAGIIGIGYLAGVLSYG